MIPDNSDNITSVITALEKISDAFGPSDSAGYSFSAWLHDELGSWGAVLVQVLIPVLIVFGGILCSCACALTFKRALMYRWIGGVVGGRVQEYIQVTIKDVPRTSEWCSSFQGEPHIYDNDDSAYKKMAALIYSV